MGEAREEGRGKRKRSASATLETSNHGGREDQTLREGQDCQLHEKQERDASQNFSSRDRRRREQGGDSFLPGKEGRLHLQGSGRRQDQTDPPSSDAFGARSPALTAAAEPLGPRSESHFQPRLWAPSAVSCSILAGSRSVPISLGTLATHKQL